ncbi:MAG: putative N-acetylglucosamine kinase [Chthonomonadales bacterium]|nr:putative N-acetylglucosamine kinase [Chthonomonadales bacterium]
MGYYLGIDGGGTKSLAVIRDDEGRECGRGTGGPGNIAFNDEATVLRSVRSAVAEARHAAGLPDTRFAAVCAGMAGYSVEPRRAAFDAALRQEVDADRYRIEPDYVIAYWGASEGEPGVVIIAGTGAVAYGRNAEGATHKEDGFGYLLGDRGSGFNLGLYALRYTLDSMQQGRSDALTDAVLAQTGAKIQNEILQWLYGEFSTARVASLAPIVGELAESGVPAARTLVAEMARRLRHTVRSIRHALWLPRNAPIYPLGGLWQLGPFFRAEFAEPTWPGHAEMPLEPEGLPGGRFTLAEPKHDAAVGAAILAAME